MYYAPLKQCDKRKSKQKRKREEKEKEKEETKLKNEDLKSTTSRDNKFLLARGIQKKKREEERKREKETNQPPPLFPSLPVPFLSKRWGAKNINIIRKNQKKKKRGRHADDDENDDDDDAQIGYQINK